MKKKIARYPIGIWIAFFALCMISLAWIMQGYSLIDWEGAVELGVQAEKFSGDSIEHMKADIERGVAIADILWGLPLTIIAFIGLFRKKLIGFVAGLMAFSVCVYFPLFYTFRMSTSLTIVLAVNILWAIPSLMGIIGLWCNRNIFTD